MYEFAALLIGIGLGLVLYRVDLWTALVLAVAGAVGGGLAVSAASGELVLSWAFLLFDVGQILVAAICTAVLARAIDRGRVTS
jgi:hypothetical protein